MRKLWKCVIFVALQPGINTVLIPSLPLGSWFSAEIHLLCQLMKEAALNGSSNNRTQMVHCHAPAEQPGGIPLSLICTQRAENYSLPWGSPFTSMIPQGHPAHLYLALILDSSNTQRSCHECFTKGALVWVDLGNLISLEDKCTHLFVTEFV